MSQLFPPRDHLNFCGRHFALALSRNNTLSAKYYRVIITFSVGR